MLKVLSSFLNMYTNKYDMESIYKLGTIINSVKDLLEKKKKDSILIHYYIIIGKRW